MSAPIPLFDTAAQTLRQARIARDPALFLQERAADDIQERLEEVNRPFTDAVVINHFPQVWEGRLAGARHLKPMDGLALTEGSADLVIHHLALHAMNDPVGQLIQCRRALRPDGLLLATLFGGETLSELRAALTAAEIAVSGGLSPRVFPMADIRDAGALLSRAGLALTVADSQRVTVSYRDPLTLMRDLRAMGEGNTLSARLRHPSRRSVLMEAARIYSQDHARPNGTVPATFEVLTLTGWAPAPDQPRPLRPGSATTRLAEALGTAERPLDPKD